MPATTIKHAALLLEDYIDENTPAMLWSAPGVGKSSIVKQSAQRRGWNLIDFRAVLRDPVDLRGIPSIDGDFAKWLHPDDLPRADRDGERGIFFMDEINAASPLMQAACFGLVLDRKVGTYELPPGWVIVAAGNRQSDRAAAQRMPTALANRFAHIEIEPDLESFTEWANASGVHPLMIAFHRFREGKFLHDMKKTDAMAFPSPRSWEQAAKYAEKPASRRLHLVAGIVGDDFAAEFDGFLRTYEQLPAIDQVILDPDGAKVPSEDEVAARYAISSALASRAKSDNFQNIMRYLNRMPREFATMVVVDACRRDPALTHTGAFIEWAKKNQDVTM
jgi:hypothetical protein